MGDKYLRARVKFVITIPKTNPGGKRNYRLNKES